MRVDAVSQGQNIDLTNISDALTKLNVGDVIKAKILEISSGEVLLKLFDGTTFKAATLANIDAKPGEYIDLMVKNKIDNQLLLETVKTSTVKEKVSGDEIKQQLQILGVKPDEKNIEIAKEIKTNNLPINKENFEKILDAVTRFENINPAKAAFLLASNLKLEEKNITSLNTLVDGKSKIANKLDDLLKVLDEVKDEAVIKNIEKQFGESDVKAQKVKNSENINNQIKPIIVSVKDKEIVQAKITNIIDTEVNKAVNKPLIDSLVIPNKAVNKPLKDSLAIPELKEKISEFLKTPIANNNELQEKVEKFMSNEMKTLEKFPPEVQKNIKATLFDLFLKSKNNKLIVSENDKVVISANKTNDNDKIQTSLRKAFGDFFAKINSETLKDDINVKDVYKDIYSKLEIVKSNVESSGILNKNEILNHIDNLQNNVKFINELNNNNTYVQIPLNIWDKNTTGELYVLKRDSKRKKIDADSATMFISLNTENLGQVDSLINVSKKNISVNMRVEDQRIIDFIKENYKELYNRMQEKGYKLSELKCRLIEEDVNITNIKELSQKEMPNGRVSIDYRL